MKPCVRCGYPENRHIRHDGSCIEQPLCKGYLASWGAEDVAAFAAEKAAVAVASEPDVESKLKVDDK